MLNIKKLSRYQHRSNLIIQNVELNSNLQYQFQVQKIIPQLTTKASMSHSIIKTTKQKKIICHRGLCSIFVENTVQSIVSGLYSSNLVELDIQLTKDNQIVVFHDRNLSRVSDIKQRKQFAHRQKLQNLEGHDKPSHDWWVRDFSLEQLKSLRLTQDNPDRPQLSHCCFKIPTLEQVLVQCLKQKNKAKFGSVLDAGLLIQIKQEVKNILSPQDKILCRQLQKLLKKLNLQTQQNCLKNRFPIILQSFNLQILNDIQTDHPQYQLYYKDAKITEQLLQSTRNAKTCGIGITDAHIENSSCPLRIICDNMNYQLNYWTLRDDKLDAIPFGMQNYRDVYLYLQKLGVNGFITEFPDLCRGYINIKEGLSKPLIAQQSLQRHQSFSTDSSRDKKFQEINAIYENQKLSDQV